MNKPVLPDVLSLKNIQAFYKDVEKANGFTNETLLQKALLLGEEVGELYKAVRKLDKVSVAQDSTENLAGKELIDILSYVFHIASKLGIDIDEYFQLKEGENLKRVWK